MRKRLAHLEALFPNLARIGYAPKSPQDDRYNCLAWAGEDTAKHWQGNNVDGYWPPGAIEGYSIEAALSAFQMIGYELCDNGRRERGYVKVVIYGMFKREELQWTHAARQLEDGRWTSKIGRELEDIIHRTPFALTGSDYGDVLHYMKRSLTHQLLPRMIEPIILRPVPRRGRDRRRGPRP
jgi:hypothetical protein